MLPKLMFVRLGWMDHYSYVSDGEQPIGGGSYTQHSLGIERDNFSVREGRVYGRVGLYTQDIRLNIRRIDTVETDAKEVRGVLVIFVSKHPEQKQTFVVGWYQNAIVYRDQMPSNVEGVADFRFTCKEEDARELRVCDRTFSIPSLGKGGLGRFNVRYSKEITGIESSEERWVYEVVDYVRHYERNSEHELTRLAEAAEDKRAGFQSDIHKRSIVENHAMNTVWAEIAIFNPEDTSRSMPFDFMYTVPDGTRYVEVKGSQSTNPEIIITSGEFKHAVEHPGRVDLYVVSEIILADGKANGGKLAVYKDWNPNEHKVKPTHYRCVLDQSKC